jgi:TrmH family RNA methyltransferase
MITSLRNDRVRAVDALQQRRKVRQRQRRFVIEGVRLIEEAARASVSPDFVFFTEDLLESPRGAALIDSLAAAGAPLFAVSAAVMAASSDTATPQGILAVVPIPDLRPSPTWTLALIADGVRDPGNLGTMLRTALAAGVEQVILTPGTVDASNPKVVRAAMGAHFRLPISSMRWEKIVEAVAGVELWLAAAGEGTPYTAVDWTCPAALIIGGEGAGAGDQARDMAAGATSIPMAKGVESLNTAVAAAVILFEIQRQRRRSELALSAGERGEALAAT